MTNEQKADLIAGITELKMLADAKDVEMDILNNTALYVEFINLKKKVNKYIQIVKRDVETSLIYDKEMKTIALYKNAINDLKSK